MSDNDLLSYYHGIHERIKDIDNSNREGRSENPTEHERMISNRTFFLSGEGHDLIQQEKIVLEELNDRDLTP